MAGTAVTGSATESPDPGRGQSATAKREAADALVEGDRRERERRGTPAERRERRESRDRFRDQSRSEAVATGRSQFREELTAPVFDARHAVKGARLVKPLGRFASVVERDGERQVVATAQASAVKDGNGDLEPVNLTMQETSDGFAPATPAAPVVVGKSLDEGLTAPDADFSLRLLSDANPAASLSNDRVWFPNAATDTDLVVMPDISGAAQDLILRSPDSPERFEFAVDLPHGARLRRGVSKNPIPGDPPRSIEIVRGDDTLGFVYPPIAYDADGSPLESSQSFDGDRIILSVEHRDEDVKYPAYVDPTVSSYSVGGSYEPWSNASWPGWDTNRLVREYQPYWAPPRGRFGFAMNDPVYSPGLYISTPSNSTFYQGDWGEYRFIAPSGLHLVEAQFYNFSHSWWASGVNVGIADPSEAVWDQPVGAIDHNNFRYANPGGFQHNFSGAVHTFCYLSPGTSVEQHLCADGGQDRNMAILRLTAYTTGATFDGGYFNTGNGRGYTAMSNSSMALGDSHPPSFKSGPATGDQPWTDDSGARHFANFTAHDDGMGLGSVELSGDVSGVDYGGRYDYIPGRCSGDPLRSHCPSDDDAGRMGYDVGEGERTVNLVVKDVLGLATPTRKWTHRIDRSAPSATPGGSLLAAGTRKEGETYTLVVDTRDTYSGVAKVEIRVDEGLPSAQTPQIKDYGCNPTNGCPRDPTDPSFSIPTRGMSPGQHSVKVLAYDAVGHPLAQPVERSFEVIESTAPTLRVSGGLRNSPVQTGRALNAVATDAGSGVEVLRVYQKPASVLDPTKPETAFLPDDLPLTADGAKPVLSAPCSGTCASHSIDYSLPDDTATGRYQMAVEAIDRRGNRSEDRWIVTVVQTRGGSRQKLGLEGWFDLDETDAGGDSTLAVNGETGNLVWHSTPIVNRGRGLSAVVNLTYNSGERGGLLGEQLGRTPMVGAAASDQTLLDLDVAGIGYREAGTGFSLSIGGLTRVNEPLTGVLAARLVEVGLAGPDSPWPAAPEGEISMTDADGTRHKFARTPGSTAWRPPSGVNLRLRYVGPRQLAVLGGLTGQQLEGDAAWEILRPDGTRFVYDRYGFQQRAYDRNGNQLDYVYDSVSFLDGSPCPASAAIAQALTDVGLCVPRLREVRQPSWNKDDAGLVKRKISLEYTTMPATPFDARSRLGLLPSTASGAPFMAGAAPQVKALTDASGRRYSFEYHTGALKGYLKEFRENDQSSSTTDSPRATRFKYDEPFAIGETSVRAGDVQQLTEVVPVVGPSELASTKVKYQPRANPDPVRPPAARRAAEIVKRSASPKYFCYQAATSSAPAGVVVHERTAANRYLTRRASLDAVGRPTQVVEQTSEFTTPCRLDRPDPEHVDADTAVKSQGSTTTKIEWNDLENKVAKLTEVLGVSSPKAKASPERVTTLEYSTTGSGALTRRLVAAGAETKDTRYIYHDINRESGFIADLYELREPGRTWRYEKETNGNTIAITSPNGVRMPATYGPGGVLETSQDEKLRLTRYSEFDPSGQPQVVTKPGAGGTSRIWRYRYDERGDVTRVVDPRGGTAIGDTDPYVTTLGYDGFGRLNYEKVPRDSKSATPSGARFVERSRRFDRDGNPVEVNDARALRTTIDYDATGQPVLVKQPGSRGVEPTIMVHDEAQRLIGQMRPRGVPGGSAVTSTAAGTLAAAIRDEQTVACEGSQATTERAYLTRMCLDHRGRTVAEADYAPGYDPVRKVSTFAYDSRDNPVGTIDPQRNRDSAGVPLTVAASLARLSDTAPTSPVWRTQTEYDENDRPTLVTEAATEANRPDRVRRMEYDVAGDLVAEVQLSAGRNDRRTTMDYDSMGRLLSRTDPLEQMTCWRRQEDGLVTSVTTPRGTAGTTAADCAGSTRQYPDYTTRSVYNEAGELAERSIPFFEGQYGPGRDDVKAWKVSYERDEVGNPTTIKVPRARTTTAAPSAADPPERTITNTFFDGGQLRSTTRPAWWSAQWPEAAGNPSAGNRFDAEGRVADVAVATDGPTISERQGRSANALAGDEAPAKPASLGQTDFGETKRSPLPDLLPQAGFTEFEYDEDMRLETVIDADKERQEIDYDNGGRVKQKSWPLETDKRIAHDFTYDLDGNLANVTEDWKSGDRAVTSFAYDTYDRRTSQTGEGAQPNPTNAEARPVSEITRFYYDSNDNVTTRRAPDVRNYRYTYSSFDELASEANPAGETWKYLYDGFGDRTDEEAPHGAGVDLAQYTRKATFDDAGQLKGQSQTVDEPGASPTQLTWGFEYDRDGNKTVTVEPGAPGPIRTQTDSDGRGLPWRTTVSGGADEKALSKTTITEYDATGSLRRQVKPAGINGDRLPEAPDNGTNESANLGSASEDATVYVRDDDDLLVRERMPWHDTPATSTAPAATDKRYERTWERDTTRSAQKWVTGIRLPTLVGSSSVYRTTYDHNDAGWITSASDLTHASRGVDDREPTAFRYEYDSQGNQTRLLSEHATTSARGRELTWSHWPNGLLKRRTAYKPQADGTRTERHYDYVYNGNRALTTVTDSDAQRERPGDQERTTLFTRDAAQRETRIDEQWRGGNDVQLDYAAGSTGWLTRRRTDGDFINGAYGGSKAKSAEFTRDSLGRELSTTVDPAQGDNRVTSTRWHGGGQMRQRTKPNGTVDRWEWDGIGRKANHDRIAPGATTDPDSQTYSYDPNGNRTRDERGTHTFNARDHLIQWKRPTDRGRSDRRGWYVNYTINGSGAMTRKVEYSAGGSSRLTTDYKVVGDRLESAEILDRTQAQYVTTRQSFRYDDFGNVQRLYSRSRVQGDATLAEFTPPKTSIAPEECQGAADVNPDDTHTTRYCYDEFNRQTFASGSGTDGAVISYDGLDRRDRRISQPSQAGQTGEERNYTYLGSSELLVAQDTKPAGSTTWQHTSFDYDSGGDRLGQDRDTGPEPRVRSYAKDANGSVIGLEKPTTGAMDDNERYAYDPYGESDNAPRPGTTLDTDPNLPGNQPDSDPDAGLSDDAKGNPFRYEGFYYDSGVRSYDMHARQYQPETGRFLSRDTYGSAAGDQALSADPLTQDRYGFAGGNPGNNIEFDGHIRQVHETTPGRGTDNGKADAAADKKAGKKIAKNQAAMHDADVAYAQDERTQSGGGPGTGAGPGTGLAPAARPAPRPRLRPAAPGGGGLIGPNEFSRRLAEETESTVRGALDGAKLLSRAAACPLDGPGGIGCPSLDATGRAVVQVAGVLPGRRGGASGGPRPPNLSPPGASRRGAFGEAKRDAGIPRTQQPAIRWERDRATGGPQRTYEFDTPNGPVAIKDHPYGHRYPDNPTHDRGGHFNGPEGQHYDYP